MLTKVLPFVFNLPQMASEINQILLDLVHFNYASLLISQPLLTHNSAREQCSLIRYRERERERERRSNCI